MREEQQYCELCGRSSKGEFYSQGSYYKVLRCRKCDLLWSDPLTDENYEKLINSDYWGEHIYLKKEHQQKQRFRRQIRKVLRLIRKEDKDKKLKALDIGSGLGFLLEVCDEFGIEPEGCDINEKAVEHANREVKRTRLGTIDEQYADNSFDIVFALNLIEHIPHPKKFLYECKRVLKPGGLLVLETPIQESLFHIMARIGDMLTGYRMNNYGINTNGHIYKFCDKAFDKLNSYGFETILKKKIGSPLKELIGKTYYMPFYNKIILKLILPFVWFTGWLTNHQNRLFIVFRIKK